MFTITLSRGYKEKEFREDLKNLYNLLAKKPSNFIKLYIFDKIKNVLLFLFKSTILIY